MPFWTRAPFVHGNTVHPPVKRYRLPARGRTTATGTMLVYRQPVGRHVEFPAILGLLLLRLILTFPRGGPARPLSDIPVFRPQRAMNSNASYCM